MEAKTFSGTNNSIIALCLLCLDLSPFLNRGRITFFLSLAMILVCQMVWKSLCSHDTAMIFYLYSATGVMLQTPGHQPDFSLWTLVQISSWLKESGSTEASCPSSNGRDTASSRNQRVSYNDLPINATDPAGSGRCCHPNFLLDKLVPSSPVSITKLSRGSGDCAWQHPGLIWLPDSVSRISYLSFMMT